MRWMKVGQACEYLGGISAKTLYEAVREGKCRAARIGQGNVARIHSWPRRATHGRGSWPHSAACTWMSSRFAIEPVAR